MTWTGTSSVPEIIVHVTLDDVNGRDADVTVKHEVGPGECIPDKIAEAAKLAAVRSWEHAVPRLHPITLSLDGAFRRP